MDREIIIENGNKEFLQADFDELVRIFAEHFKEEKRKNEQVTSKDILS